MTIHFGKAKSTTIINPTGNCGCPGDDKKNILQNVPRPLPPIDEAIVSEPKENRQKNTSFQPVKESSPKYHNQYLNKKQTQTDNRVTCSCESHKILCSCDSLGKCSLPNDDIPKDSDLTNTTGNVGDNAILADSNDTAIFSIKDEISHENDRRQTNSTVASLCASPRQLCAYKPPNKGELPTSGLLIDMEHMPTTPINTKDNSMLVDNNATEKCFRKNGIFPETVRRQNDDLVTCYCASPRLICECNSPVNCLSPDTDLPLDSEHNKNIPLHFKDNSIPATGNTTTICTSQDEISLKQNGRQTRNSETFSSKTSDNCKSPNTDFPIESDHNLSHMPANAISDHSNATSKYSFRDEIYLKPDRLYEDSDIPDVKTDTILTKYISTENHNNNNGTLIPYQISEASNTVTVIDSFAQHRNSSVYDPKDLNQRHYSHESPKPDSCNSQKQLSDRDINLRRTAVSKEYVSLPPASVAEKIIINEIPYHSSCYRQKQMKQIAKCFCMQCERCLVVDPNTLPFPAPSGRQAVRVSSCSDSQAFPVKLNSVTDKSTSFRGYRCLEDIDEHSNYNNFQCIRTKLPIDRNTLPFPAPYKSQPMRLPRWNDSFQSNDVDQYRNIDNYEPSQCDPCSYETTYKLSYSQEGLNNQDMPPPYFASQRQAQRCNYQGISQPIITRNQRDLCKSLYSVVQRNTQRNNDPQSMYKCQESQFERFDSDSQQYVPAQPPQCSNIPHSAFIAQHIQKQNQIYKPQPRNQNSRYKRFDPNFLNPHCGTEDQIRSRSHNFGYYSNTNSGVNCFTDNYNPEILACPHCCECCIYSQDIPSDSRYETPHGIQKNCYNLRNYDNTRNYRSCNQLNGMDSLCRQVCFESCYPHDFNLQTISPSRSSKRNGLQDMDNGPRTSSYRDFTDLDLVESEYCRCPICLCCSEYTC